MGDDCRHIDVRRVFWTGFGWPRRRTLSVPARKNPEPVPSPPYPNDTARQGNRPLELRWPRAQHDHRHRSVRAAGDAGRIARLVFDAGVAARSRAHRRDDFLVRRSGVAFFARGWRVPLWNRGLRPVHRHPDGVDGLLRPLHNGGSAGEPLHDVPGRTLANSGRPSGASRRDGRVHRLAGAGQHPVRGVRREGEQRICRGEAGAAGAVRRAAALPGWRWGRLHRP